MSNQDQWIDANQRVLERVPKLTLVFAALLIIGIVGFVIGMDGTPLRSYQAFWVNFIFFAGIAQGGVILAAVHNVVNAKWGGTMVRLGLLNVTFTVVTVVLYLGIAFAASDMYKWVHNHDLAYGKEWWLNLPFLLIRDGIGLMILAFFGLVFAYKTLRPEIGKINAEAGKTIFPAFFAKNFKGYEEEKEASMEFLRLWNPVFLFLYAIIYSMLGFDLIMSLEPAWFSTLFGAYFFITCIYTGIAMVVVLSALLRRDMHLENHLHRNRFHDIGKLMFGFCILSTDFFWSQFLVIWYGDLPEFNFWILQRTTENPWFSLSGIVLFFGFIIPFVLLIARKPKRTPIFLAGISLIALLGVFVERAVATLRSVYPETGADFPIGIIEVMVFLGFLGLYGFVMNWTMRRSPLIPPESFKNVWH